MRLLRVLVVAGLLTTIAVTGLFLSDEGMWTFDNPPLKILQERYGFTPTREWLDHIRLSSVRFNDGGSGSFVSPNGLAITNHHVVFGQLSKLSTQEKNYASSGFYARTQAEELKCPDLELNVLAAMENVSARVQGAVKSGMTEKQALDARREVIARIQKESFDATGLRSDVVTLYDGGEYWLYRYKKYTDVRMVFAPEQQAAFFGGDADNFTFPRYDLDFAVVRVYENDRPIVSKDYLKWNSKGAAEGELIFVSGHPGGTSRGNTLSQVEFDRDHFYPFLLDRIKRKLEMLRRYSTKGSEQARQAADEIFNNENGLKALTGEYNGLQDKNFFAKKTKEENDLRAKVAGTSEWRRDYGEAWDAISRAMKKQSEIYRQQQLRSIGNLGSRLGSIAGTIVRYATETKKPDGQRLNGYHEAELEERRFFMFSPAPIYPEYEEAQLTHGLQEVQDQLGPNDPYVVAMLGGRKPAEVAAAAVKGTKLMDPQFRRSLVEGGEAAVAASMDPMIVLARKSDPFNRETRKTFEDSVEAVLTSAGEKIAKARFAIYGKSLYPDATFTLRLAFGTVRGYPMNGTVAPTKTTYHGLYDRATSFDFKPPFNLTEQFIRRKDRLNLATPLNFVSTADIIGGNSGSPVINRNGEFVGVIFDGNIESLLGNFAYVEETNRAIAVHAGGIIEALIKVYDAESLAKELEGTGSR